MFSKQVVAFIMGAIMVTSAIGCFVYFENQYGRDNEAEASSGSNSVHVPVDNSRYGFKLVSVESTARGYVTTFSAIVEVPELGYFEAFVGDTQLLLAENDYRKYVEPGKYRTTFTVCNTDSYHSGIGLLEEIRLVFSPVKPGTYYDLQFSTYYYKNSTYGRITFGQPIPDGTPVILYWSGFMKYWFPVGGMIDYIDPNPEGLDTALFLIDGYSYHCKVLG